MAVPIAEIAALASVLVRVASTIQTMSQFQDRDPTEQEIALLEAEKNAADAAWQQALARLRGGGAI